MPSHLIRTFKGPVRILIRTRLADLDKLDPCVETADTRLIEKFHVQLFSGGEIRHLITRISDKKKSEKVDIVFDHDVRADDGQPEVMAFKVKVEDSTLRITPFHNPQIQSTVNRTIEVYKEISFESATCMPRRVDIRAETLRKRRTAVDVSEVSAYTST